MDGIPVLKPELTPREIVVEYADQYGVDRGLALAIVTAESKFDCSAKNKYSSAKGLYQFVDRTWLNTMKRMGKPQNLSLKSDCRLNAEAGAFLLAHKELHHWNASRHNWSQN